MERIKLDYKPLRAAVARRDRAHVEVEARKLRDQHLANLVIHGASDVWSVIMLVGRQVLAWSKHRYEAAPKVSRLFNFIRM